MARTVTLATLRTRVRQLADLENSAFVSDTELTDKINEAITELYDLLVRAAGDEYYATTSSITTTAGTAAYALPATFYKLCGVDWTNPPSGGTATLEPYTLLARNMFTGEANGWSFYQRPRYRLNRTNINFIPTPDAGQAITLHYVPTPTALSADGDTFDGIDGWEKLVVYTAAIECLIKEESDPSALMALREQVRQRIESQASERDIGAPAAVTDVGTLDYEPASRWRG